MDVREAGRQGGQRKSAAKQAAARRNGARGGRPGRLQALLRRMRAMHAKVEGRLPDMDPHDLDLIIERLCRRFGDGRRFFIRPRIGGGYEV